MTEPAQPSSPSPQAVPPSRPPVEIELEPPVGRAVAPVAPSVPLPHPPATTSSAPHAILLAAAVALIIVAAAGAALWWLILR